MVDYREDMRFSDEMLKRVAEAYRKVRNTLPLPALEPVRLRSRRRTRWPRPRSTSSTATRWPGTARWWRASLDAYDDVRVPPRLPPARAVLRGGPLVLLPRRAQGPALLRRRRRRRAAAPRRPCSTASPATWPLLMAPVLPFTADEVWPRCSRAARGLGPPRPSSRAPRPPTTRCSSRWAGAARRPRRGDEGPRGGPRGQADRRRAWRRGSWCAARPPTLEAAARARRAARSVFPGNLANLFIVSQVAPARTADGPLAVEVEHARRRASASAAGPIRRTSGTLAVHPGVCERCAEVLEPTACENAASPTCCVIAARRRPRPGSPRRSWCARSSCTSTGRSSTGC